VIECLQACKDIVVSMKMLQDLEEVRRSREDSLRLETLLDIDEDTVRLIASKEEEDEDEVVR